MHSKVTPVVLILGANGRFGSAAAQAFSDAGWQVIAQSRSVPPRSLPRNAVALQCDALDVEQVLRRCAGNVQVIVNALSPAYTEWERLVPPLAHSALELARRTGALLMLPGNVYNFGARLPEMLVEGTPQVADTAKAAIRIDLERQMEAASAEGVRSVVIRAGDFLGGTGTGTWLDMVIAKKLDKGEATWPGPLDVPHAWALLPDLARVFVAVAEHRANLRPFEVFHYGGLTLTGREFLASLERVAGRALKVKQLPWWLLKLASPFVPMFSALLKMRYLWQRPHRLDDGKLRALIGTPPCTPLDRVLRDSLPAQYLASRVQRHELPAKQ